MIVGKVEVTPKPFIVALIVVALPDTTPVNVAEYVPSPLSVVEPVVPELEPPLAEYSSTMLLAAIPSPSEAVQVMACTEPTGQLSPPFGDVTATTGVERSTLTDAAVPTAEASDPLEQSRSATEVIVSVPGPLRFELPAPTVNNVPLVAPEPHGRPSVTPSTV